MELLFRARPVAHVVRLRLCPEPVSTIFFPFESSYCLWADHATRWGATTAGLRHLSGSRRWATTLLIMVLDTGTYDPGTFLSMYGLRDHRRFTHRVAKVNKTELCLNGHMVISLSLGKTATINRASGGVGAYIRSLRVLAAL